MGKLPIRKPALVQKTKGPRQNYHILDPWLPAEKRTGAQRANYVEEHPCAFCGAIGFRHRLVRRKTAKLFCDDTCRAAYKRLHLWPRHKRLIPTPLPPRRKPAPVNESLKQLLNSPVTYTRPNYTALPVVKPHTHYARTTR